MSDKLRRTESLPLEPREASSCGRRRTLWKTLEVSLTAWVMFVWGVCWRALLQSIFCTCLNPYIPLAPEVKTPLSKLFSQSLGSGLCSSAPRAVGRARADSLARWLSGLRFKGSPAEVLCSSCINALVQQQPNVLPRKGYVSGVQEPEPDDFSISLGSQVPQAHSWEFCHPLNGN